MMSGDNPNGEMVVYVGDDGKPQIQARLQDEDTWLTQVQLAQVFQTTRQNIVQAESDREVSRNIERYLEELKGVQKNIEGKK